VPLGPHSHSEELTGRLLSSIEGEAASLSLAPFAQARRGRTALSFRMEEGLARRALSPVVGVDEVGRGPLAGPVVAAAVLWSPRLSLPGLNDSKRLSPGARTALFPRILECAGAVAVGLVTAEGIDRWNIRRASAVAMARAVEGLAVTPGWVLVDGTRLDDFPYRQIAVVGGDGKIPTVAAASVVAKVVRDRLMDCYHQIFPVYRFDRHKGYPTAEHAERIHRFGLSPIHRRTFHVPDISPRAREEEWIA
jgi:ribonuclease HII